MFQQAVHTSALIHCAQGRLVQLCNAKGAAQGPSAALTARPPLPCHLPPPQTAAAMPFNLAKWFIEGEVDWDYYQELLQSWGPALAGALFGAGPCVGGTGAGGRARELCCRSLSTILGALGGAASQQGQQQQHEAFHLQAVGPRVLFKPAQPPHPCLYRASPPSPGRMVVLGRRLGVPKGGGGAGPAVQVQLAGHR